MKSLKNHIAVILPLFVLLFCMQLLFSINTVVQNYEKKLTDGYVIMIVSQKSLDENILKSKIASIDSMSEISSKEILDRLKKDISSTNLSLLQVALPKFYSIKLKKLPSQKALDGIKKEFQKIDSITKVETFSQTYSKIYKMFLFVQQLSSVFVVLILIISVLLIFKQMKIWVLEHQERMSIMTLFGAPFWMKSAFLYKLAILDSILSAIFVGLLFYYAPQILNIKLFFESIDVVFPRFDLVADLGFLLGFSVIFSFFIVSFVIAKMRTS
ncbi:MAG: ABC transporter permease [Sulfurospirillum sp.]|nr:ABC transporter permease [Sulfurospirillum sp.]